MLCWIRLGLVFHKRLDCGEGLVGDVVLDFAGVVRGTFGADAEADEEVGEELVALIHLHSNLAAEVGEGKVAVLIHINISARA